MSSEKDKLCFFNVEFWVSTAFWHTANEMRGKKMIMIVVVITQKRAFRFKIKP